MTEDLWHQSCFQGCCSGRTKGLFLGRISDLAGDPVGTDIWQNALDIFKFRLPLLAGLSFDKKLSI